MELQRPVRKKAEEDTAELLDFDERQWQEELERKKKERLQQYENSLAFIIDAALDKGSLSMSELKGCWNKIGRRRKSAFHLLMCSRRLWWN